MKYNSIFAALLAASLSIAFLPTASADCGDGNGEDTPEDNAAQGCRPKNNGGDGSNFGGDQNVTIDYSGALSGNTVEGGTATSTSGATATGTGTATNTNDFSGALSGNTVQGGSVESGAVTNTNDLSSSSSLGAFNEFGGSVEEGAVTNNVEGSTAHGGSGGTVLDLSSNRAYGGNVEEGAVNNTMNAGDNVDNSYDLNYNMNYSDGGDAYVNTEGTVGDVTNTTNVDTTGTVGDVTSGSSSDQDQSQAQVQGQDQTQTSTSSVGDTSSSSDNENNSGVEFNYSYENIQTAASAASVFTSYCQNGASAQAPFGGFSISNNDQFCDHIRMADYWWGQYEKQVQIAVAFQCDTPDMPEKLTERCATTGERLLVSLDKAWDNTETANKLLENSEWAAHVDRQIAPVSKLGTLLGVLVFLL